MRGSINHDAADRLARMHQVEPLVDLFERQFVGDQVVDIDFTFHVPVDDLRYVGAASRAAKSGSLPNAAGDQLKWPGRNFLTCPRNTDDDADTPAAVTTLQRLTHDIDIADAFET